MESGASSWTDMSLWKHVELRLTGSKLTYAYDKTNMFFQRREIARTLLLSNLLNTHANGVHFTVVPKDAGQGVMVFKTTSEEEAQCWVRSCLNSQFISRSKHTLIIKQVREIMRCKGEDELPSILTLGSTRQLFTPATPEKQIRPSEPKKRTTPATTRTFSSSVVIVRNQHTHTTHTHRYLRFETFDFQANTTTLSLPLRT